MPWSWDLFPGTDLDSALLTAFKLSHGSSLLRIYLIFRRCGRLSRQLVQRRSRLHRSAAQRICVRLCNEWGYSKLQGDYLHTSSMYTSATYLKSYERVLSCCQLLLRRHSAMELFQWHDIFLPHDHVLLPSSFMHQYSYGELQSTFLINWSMLLQQYLTVAAQGRRSSGLLAQRSGLDLKLPGPGDLFAE